MTLDRWIQFSKREQFLFIGGELERARVWQEKGVLSNMESALERALGLVDLSLRDAQWQEDAYKFLVLRSAIANHFIGETKDNIHYLYKAL